MQQLTDSAPPPSVVAAPGMPPDIIADDAARGGEHFIPLTRYAVADRLSRPQYWPPGMATDVRRFFNYLNYWRQQRHNTALMHLLQAYEPFNPDSDLFVTRRYTEDERRGLKHDVLDGIERLLRQANYVRVPPENVETMILTRDSHYGLDLKVDFRVFEDILVYYRGASVKKQQRRVLSRFLRKQEFDVPIFRRVCVVFKLRSEADHIEHVMRTERISRADAQRHVRRIRKAIPTQISDSNIYLKLFKNMPRSDIEMVFPNTQVKFRAYDKLWLGLSSGGALGAGIYGALGKLALLLIHPMAAIGAVGGIFAVLYRQVSNVMNQKQRYMTILAQNLYFHSMADNRGVMVKLADSAAEEDLKEEILLYSVLAKEQVRKTDLAAVDEAIERYIMSTFGLDVDFDVSDAYERLLYDGVIAEEADGTISTLPPKEAALHIDGKWDRILDDLPEMEIEAGTEIDRPSEGAT